MRQIFIAIFIPSIYEYLASIWKCVVAELSVIDTRIDETHMVPADFMSTPVEVRIDQQTPANCGVPKNTHGELN